jgi:hypothetical protein
MVLVVARALLALQVQSDLSSNTDTVSDLAACCFVANLDTVANGLVHGPRKWEGGLRPTAVNSMNIRATGRDL